MINNLNQYSSAGGNALSYNDNGNLTAYKGWSYGYDAHNRLTTASKTGTSVSLGYDPSGNLISNSLNSVATKYVYSGDQLIGEYTSTGAPINLYIYAPGSDIPIARFSGSSGLTDVKYLRSDERGSIVAETVGTTAVESHQYDVYGVPLNTSNSLFRYTGQIQLKGPAPQSEEVKVLEEVLVTGHKNKGAGMRFNVRNEMFFIADQTGLTKRKLKQRDIKCSNGITMTVGRFRGGLGAGQAAAHTHTNSHEQIPGQGDGSAARKSTTGAVFMMTSSRVFAIEAMSNGTFRTTLAVGNSLTDGERATLIGYMQDWENPLSDGTGGCK